jgi:hypothetical protein
VLGLELGLQRRRRLPAVRRGAEAVVEALTVISTLYKLALSGKNQLIAVGAAGFVRLGLAIFVEVTVFEALGGIMLGGIARVVTKRPGIVSTVLIHLEAAVLVQLDSVAIST